MDSLVGYGSDDDNETERFSHHTSVGQGTWSQPGSRRRDDDTNYDDVNMDLSEESQGAESEPELPPAESSAVRRCPERPERLKRPNRQDYPDRSNSDDSRERDRERDYDRDRERNRDRDRDQDRKDRRRDSPPRPRPDRDREERDKDRSPRREDRYHRSDRPERSRGTHEGSSRRGLLGDRPDERSSDSKVPALMDLKPFGDEPPPGLGKSQDARDAVSPRFVDRDRRDRDRDRDRDRERERERDKERHSRRSEERRSSGHRHGEHRSRSRGAAYPPPPSHSSERRGSPPSGDYRPSSYKVNKKLEVMEKMGLQIKTPDGSMATAQQLRAAASETPAHSGLPTYFNSGSMTTNKIMDQVQKRKLLWSNKNKSEAEEAAKWSGTRFAQDSDGKQVSKFMRLMGIKEPAALKPSTPDASADPNKKQEELFQAMQAQYEVARATTHTMRGVGLGFQRGQF